jgi:hypothetical protein
LSEVFRKWASSGSPSSAPDKIQMVIFEVILLLCSDEVSLSPGTKNISFFVLLRKLLTVP